MKTSELQTLFFKEKGIEPFNSQGEPDIDYVEWLEAKTICQLAIPPVNLPGDEKILQNLYDKHVTLLFDDNGHQAYALEYQDLKKLLTDLSQLSPKQEDNAKAVLFADWIVEKDWQRKLDGKWYGCEYLNVVNTTQELFEIYCCNNK